MNLVKDRTEPMSRQFQYVNDTDIHKRSREEVKIIDFHTEKQWYKNLNSITSNLLFFKNEK